MSNHIHEYYQQGKQAFLDGQTVEDNPYKVQGAARSSWEAGYTEEWYVNYMENIDV